jgi:hypothetical protein
MGEQVTSELTLREGQFVYLTLTDAVVRVVYLGTGGKRVRGAVGAHPWVRMLSDHGVYSRGSEVRVSWDRLSARKGG